jgi:DNA-binding SARP family transcriptional activator
MTAEPLDEESCRLAMRASDVLGLPAVALLVYERLRHALADEFGVAPAQPTRALHLAILRGQSISRDGCDRLAG